MRGFTFYTLATFVCALTAGQVHGEVIDNDIASGTLGHFSVDVLTGGETYSTTITANAKLSGLTTTNIMFAYLSGVDVGIDGSVVRLSGSAPTLTGDDTVRSTGSFVGATGNTIDWIVDSFIQAGSNKMSSVFTFTAQTGELGELRFYQYLDEDVLSVADDVLTVRGSVAGGDLELFTIDDDELIGISHGGALSTAQGLVNSSFTGWAADEYSDLLSILDGATVPAVSYSGVIDTVDLVPFTHPNLGQSWGPADITSALAWDLDSSATTAVVVTTLGGIPDIVYVPPAVPEPSTLALLLIGGAGLGVFAGPARTYRQSA